MLVIALTGGIGSGKSTVATLFARHGVPIIDADVIARDVTLPHESAFKEIISHFGNTILSPDGTLNRSALRHIIFEHSHERIWLENLLHPLIQERIEHCLSLISAPYCIIIIPLLFETKPYPFINRILVIDTTEQHQIERAKRRDKANSDQISAILKAQSSRENRLKGAHDIISNNGTITELTPQVEKLHALYSHLGTQ